jgi:hypothetical protein
MPDHSPGVIDATLDLDERVEDASPHPWGDAAPIIADPRRQFTALSPRFHLDAAPDSVGLAASLIESMPIGSKRVASPVTINGCGGRFAIKPDRNPRPL